MIWRTDKPTEKVIVAKLTEDFCHQKDSYAILRLADEPYQHYSEDGEEIPYSAIEKWASLEEKKLPEDLEEAAKEYARLDDEGVWKDGGKYKGFIAGAQYAAPRWISVEEKLPEMDEEVIVLTDEHNTAPIYKVGVGHIVDRRYAMDFNGWNFPGVRYWMPCPKIPEV